MGIRNPDAIIIRALIPDSQSERYVVDQDGNPPQRQFEPVDGTYEKTLDHITKDAVGEFGKIDKRVPAAEKDKNDITYLLQAYGERSIISSQYTWGTLSETE